VVPLGTQTYSTPVVAGGKAYIGTPHLLGSPFGVFLCPGMKSSRCGGDFWVLAASGNKRVISSIDLDSPMHSTPVAANGVLYVATMKKLYAVKKSTE